MMVEIKKKTTKESMYAVLVMGSLHNAINLQFYQFSLKHWKHSSLVWL